MTQFTLFYIVCLKNYIILIIIIIKYVTILMILFLSHATAESYSYINYNNQVQRILIYNYC